MSAEGIVRVQAVIRGRVQGVGYRINCARQAEALGLAGSVANAPDGAVVASFEGPPESVEAMLAWCRVGPRFASVIDVATTEQPLTGATHFRVR